MSVSYWERSFTYYVLFIYFAALSNNLQGYQCRYLSLPNLKPDKIEPLPRF